MRSRRHARAALRLLRVLVRKHGSTPDELVIDWSPADGVAARELRITSLALLGGASEVNLQPLEAFYWIARLGSFHAAAWHLRMAQRSVSARMRELVGYAQQMLALAGEVEQQTGSRDLNIREMESDCLEGQVSRWRLKNCPPSGNDGETDVFGSEQYAQLSDVAVPEMTRSDPVAHFC